MYFFALTILGNREDARDAVQDVWLRVLTAKGEFRGEATEKTYLYSITRNECLRLLKRESRSLDGLDGERLVSAEDDPLQALERKELKEDVEWCLTELPPVQSACLLLRIEEGMTYKEIADALSVTEDVVTISISRGRDRVKRTLVARGITV